ncbi:MAG TPA: MFS transporter [Candidatus Aminicenantes bacterium]|nr:MFS transporter [Candidatus Aminicenantes bacterium]
MTAAPASSFRAFSSRRYRLYFSGQGISLIGTWIQQLAASWLVFRMTRSPFWLGVVAFASQAPSIVLTPLAGVLADRWSRHRMMITIQTLDMALALIMAGLIWTGWVTIGWVVAISSIFGIVGAFDAPTRHAFVVQLVEKREHLPNAITLNSIMFNAARLIGPSVAGLLIAWIGEGGCFFINGLSFLAVIAALLAMGKMPGPVDENPREGIWQGLRDGVQVTFRHPILRPLILFAAWMGFCCYPYTVLMPVLANVVLGGGPRTLGLLLGSLGGGALIGGFLQTRRQSVRTLAEFNSGGAFLLGGSLFLLAFSRNLPTAMAILLACGLGTISQLTSGNTQVQLTAPEEYRARIMSFLMLAFFGTVPLGSLVFGTLAGQVGTPAVLAGAGAAAMAGAIVFARAMSRHEGRPFHFPSPWDLITQATRSPRS